MFVNIRELFFIKGRSGNKEKLLQAAQDSY